MARATHTKGLGRDRLTSIANSAASKTKEKPKEEVQPVLSEERPEGKRIDTEVKRGRPPKNTTVREPGNKKGLQPGQERFSVVIDTALLEELRDLVYTERITLKEAITAAVEAYIQSRKDAGIKIINRP